MPGVVRIGVDAPDDLAILREELVTDGKLPAAPTDAVSSPDAKSHS